mmetsp:Transcript_26027/g.38470  ORF Transcript_26027/g.38470 Transcript_26027/m.38470 type:complete len:547 (-) Transcript_26027:187-1827(-)|eukprot:CAMPEP_0194202862 /NCGR_PEP_ID=MMETSP0156-20130528/2780_1 /TAXON_ID=33649 /ORGANISM="Thalassionema nitzschioides, Strain L26-B" /LENGTH=546 /DNA_ID=CAMNT_0038928469 /DNA_START=82 /DNA_END=1722 /DNA_ORIENTATION=-
MDEILRSQYGDAEWPEEAENMYERVEVLGRGSFGVVWMACRLSEPENELDDEFVAIKNIEIKEEKGRIYAQREISILREIRHPNIIRLIRAFPIYKKRCQLVAMQMARGPNLQYLVTRRGALGFPLSRLIARHLIAAVSYLHGRAVIHRDIKPTNCILENTELATQEIYDWIGDDMIWSDSAEAEKVVATGKFKLMLVDFGFARALDHDEIAQPVKRMRNSIVNESQGMNLEQIAKLVAEEDGQEATRQLRKASIVDGAIPEDIEKLLDEVDSEDEKEKETEKEEVNGDKNGHSEQPVPVDKAEEQAPPDGTSKRRKSYVSMPVPFKDEEPQEDPPIVKEVKEKETVRKPTNRRQRLSMTRSAVRSMSALGTKAYAAPEIKHQLRNKTRDDIERSLEALTECVADYGMIVDAYSVGWTLRVILTGIPPNVTISKYMRKVASIHEQAGSTGCLCFKSKAPPPPQLKVRDISELPRSATLLISMLTRTKPENRITVREAQNHPYIRGGLDGEPVVELPSGDIPSNCGDPVIPLECAKHLAKEQKSREK